jgi:hypothetical protein
MNSLPHLQGESVLGVESQYKRHVQNKKSERYLAF